MRMKRLNQALFTSALLLGLFTYSCQNANDPNDTMDNNMNERGVMDENEMEDNTYMRDIDDYRYETSAEFAANDSIIANWRTELEGIENNEERERLKREVDDLERRNNDMRNRMNDYRAEGRENWEQFKEEFSHDMNELGEAFKNLVIDNR